MRESSVLTLPAVDEAATRSCGAALAEAADCARAGGLVVALEGDLGAGKTTFVRGLLSRLGVRGSVRSPTYTLLETHSVGGWTVQHLDWYRLQTAADLEGLGFRDLAGPDTLVLIEWATRLPEIAARADLRVRFDYLGTGRELQVTALTPSGAAVLKVFRGILERQASI